MVTLGRVIEQFQRPIAEAAKAAGGGDKKSNSARSGGGSSPKRSKPRDESKRTSSVAAAACGVDRRTYEKAKSVAQAVDDETKPAGRRAAHLRRPATNLFGGQWMMPRPAFSQARMYPSMIAWSASRRPTSRARRPA